jgi:hypothetical protein
MKLYGGIDLHSNNSVVALLDEDERLVYRKRLANDAPGILEALAPYHEAIVGLVVPEFRGQARIPGTVYLIPRGARVFPFATRA